MGETSSDRGGDCANLFYGVQNHPLDQVREALGIATTPVAAP